MGLGNPGREYEMTRHNTGFMVVDELANKLGATFEDKRYGFVAETSIKGRKVFILKPTTYMLSLIHISEPTRPAVLSRMPSSA